MARCCRTLPVVGVVWLLTTVLAASAGDVNYRDVIVNRARSDYMSRYFRRLYRRQRHCEEPGLTERVGVADVILTGTVREIEDDRRHPGSEVARVEVKRVIKDHRQSGERYIRKSIRVRGIGDNNTCGSDANVRDSWIFLLDVIDDATFRLNSSLMRVTLTNIERVEALVTGVVQQPGTRRLHAHGRSRRLTRRPTSVSSTTVSSATTTTSHPCSTLTCRHGARCVLEDGTAQCRCPPPSDCTTSPQHQSRPGPVCGSDHNDYSSECDMLAASCIQQRHIDKLYDGYCDKCRETRCDFHSTCVTDSSGTATCVCPSPSSCPQGGSSQICGSDGKFYSSQCEMRVASCSLRQRIEPADHQHCDPCHSVECSGRGQQCIDGRCVCRNRSCPTNYDPVCGTDSVTYPNQCTLDMIACTEHRDVDTLHRGVCVDEFMGSGVEEWHVLPPSGSDDERRPSTTTSGTPTTMTSPAQTFSRCGDSVCLYGAQCVSDRPHRCVCRFNCDAVRSTVCGSDGKLYASECLMREESCRRQKRITAVSIDNCEDLDMEVELCDGKEPLVNPVTGQQYNCDEETCPAGSYCHRVDHQPSRCCRGDDGVSVVVACDVTEFGCCPDGVTAALGSQHAGCPSKCRCNSLGSLVKTCDPVTGQCRCKRGVGGLRCDRCEPSYWGLQLAANNPNNTGCIPCACNVHGSVRDDCDQMTGRCRCRPGISGHKCHRCANGVTIGPLGCQRPAADGPAAASVSAAERDECTADRCQYGAVCDIKDGRAQCVCPYDCHQTDGPAVCGTDGRRYRSLCHLIQRACRRQRLIRPSLAKRC